ncbi:MAG: ATP-binding protein [Cyanobacteria bacterium J06627_8]
MTTDNIGLEKFIQLVPSCLKTESLACLASCFNQGKSDAVVIVDGNHYPIGIVKLSHWMAYRAQLMGCVADSSQWAAPVRPLPYRLQDGSNSANSVKHQNKDNAANCIQCSTGDDPQCLTRDDEKNLRVFTTLSQQDSDDLPILPVVSVPAHWNLRQFLDHVQSLRTPNERSPLSLSTTWVIVDRQGAYLGILDDRSIWQAFASDARLAADEPQMRGEIDSNSSLSLPSRYLPLTDSLELLSTEQRTQSSSAAQSKQSFERSHVIIDRSIQILQNLPVPVMAQTNHGQVIFQNDAWQRCIRELQNPDIIRQQVGQLFKDVRPIDTDSVPAVFCELGSSQHDCVCTCLTKDGQYKTWKFIKVLLPSLTHELNRASTNASALDSATAQFVPATSALKHDFFQFAPLLQQNPSSLSQLLSFDDTSAFEAAMQVWIVIAHDLTAQHQLSDSLIVQNEKLSQTNHIKDELLKCLTHELKTPLTAILGLSNLLKDEAIGTLNDRQTQYANLLHKSGRQLTALVNTVLTLTRLEDGDLQLNREWVHLPTLCEHAYKEALEAQGIGALSAQSIYPILTTNNLTLDLQIQSSAQHGFFDKLRLQQILVQLLTNALKFSQAQGKITLNVKRRQRWLIFEVVDTGDGIPIQQQKDLLQTFYTFGDGATHAVEGSGLGLVFVKKLVNLQRGVVSFCSEDGKGSRFTVVLPLQPSFETETGQHSIGPSQPNRMVIIVAEAPAAIAQLVNGIESEGYDAIIARSEQEALKKAQILQPCCMVLDFSIADFSVAELLVKLKAHADTQSIPVMALGNVSDCQRSQQLGAEIQIPQPVHLDRVKQHLNEIQRHAVTSEPTTKPITVLYVNPDKDRLGVGEAKSQMSSDFNDAAAIADAQSGEDQSESFSTSELSAILHPYHCRVLEIDDVSQAGVLSRVWKPDVILLSAQTSDAAYVLNLLSQHEDLQTLPIITLTLEHTETANRLKGLKVFPCLNVGTGEDGHMKRQSIISPLVEVIRVAAGVHRTPRLAILSTLDSLSDTDDCESTHDSIFKETPETDIQSRFDQLSLNDLQYAKRLAALVKYCQMAGIHSSIHSIKQSLNDTSVSRAQPVVDSVLIYDSQAGVEAKAQILQAVEAIKVLDNTLPIIVWIEDKHGSYIHSVDAAYVVQLKTLGAEVIFGTRPMHEVVEVIRIAIANPIE